jgi:hypothetical protein
MSFDYCVVQLTRPWLSGDFLATPGWYVPGMTEGSYSSGPEPVVSALAGSTSAQAGTSSPATQQQPATYGPLTFIPTAFVAIKSLAINASAIDGGATSTGPVTAFGPFSLVNATGAANALTASGNPGHRLDLRSAAAVTAGDRPSADPRAGVECLYGSRQRNFGELT